MIWHVIYYKFTATCYERHVICYKFICYRHMFMYEMTWMPYHFFYLLHVIVTFHESHDSIMKYFPCLVMLHPLTVKTIMATLSMRQGHRGNPMRDEYNFMLIHYESPYLSSQIMLRYFSSQIMSYYFSSQACVMLFS